MIMSSSAIPVNAEVRHRLRPIGRNNDYFRAALAGYQQLAVWADELGYDGFGSTEHHFQIEGGESIPNNLLLYAKFAALTKRIMFVPMSVVVTTHDPIRVAEDLALFTHMYPGRLGVAFARGFMTRWVQTLSQSEGVVSHGPGDALNRRKFDEFLAIIDDAWSKDSFNHSGEFYQAPFPATGIANWPLAAWTRQFGGPGDVDDDGTLRKIGITPKPFERPPIFIPSTAAEQTIIDSARNGRTLMIAAAGREKIRQVAERYREAAREAGKDLRLGQNVGVVAKVVLGETFDEAFELAVQTAGFWYQNIFREFYFNEGYRRPSDPPERPLNLGDARGLCRRFYEAGQLLCGTADQVHDQMKGMAEVYGGGQLDWLFWEYWTQSVPSDDWEGIQRYQLETYARQILPRISSPRT
jgi:alkanesulfonate monooxygenase SsuD/methylene tetrahydromethanopterin reductase-like flavin-dependent oxidoreductase (luciferase family)